MAHICTQHPDKIKFVETTMTDVDSLLKMSDFLKVLADATRLRIVGALLESELCVCDLAHILCMEHSAVSHQLAVLRKADAVKTRKDGKVVYYSLSDEHVAEIFNVTKTHVDEPHSAE